MQGEPEDDVAVLGKRKHREDHAQVRDTTSHGSTVFVSNLPYNATSVDLQTLFSDIAPVRSAFVVLEGGVSKGVGYVAFAIKEDATNAMETIEKDGLELNGRKLRVQWAENKPREKTERVKERPKIEAKPGETKPEAIPRGTPVRGPKDPNAIRTIIISGLPPSIDQKTLWKKIRKYDGAEKAELGEVGSGIATALFKTPAAASRAVEKLHAHIFKGALLSVALKKRVETLSKGAGNVGTVDPNKGSAAAPSRGSRLIVRNLPWDITERDLRALFLPYGPMHSVHIPGTIKEAGKKPKARGFAFVWFLSKKDAERAIEGVNGRLVSAGAVTAPTMNKKERARLRRALRESLKDGQAPEDPEVKEEDADGSGDEKEHGKQPDSKGRLAERVIAVDWALSKERWEEAKEQGAVPDAEGAAEDSSEAASSSDDEDGASESSKSSSAGPGDSEPDDAGSDDDHSDRMDVDDDDQVPATPSLPAPEAGTTLFIRNVPFDATEDELRTLFRAFGPLRYARITMDAATGRSRGTGFACFWNKEDADKAVHQSELLSRDTGIIPVKKNPFTLPSLLTPDPSSSLAQSLVLHGRTLDVTRAVTREDAARLKEEGERKREKADKRNMYLLREGVIFPNTPAAASLTEAEVEKRTTSFTTRRALLKSNPSLYISKTRLSVRQLPLFTTERSLKRLAIHAIRAFEDDVKKGTREALSKDELLADTEVDPNIEEHDADGVLPVNKQGMAKEKGKDGKRGKSDRKTGVKQAKIVRQADRVDSITGKGRSRGYGFLEMDKHTDALRVLRWANNNPDVGGLLEKWWKAEVEELAKKGPVKSSETGEGDVEKPNVDSQELRMKRLKEELGRVEAGTGRKSKGTLVIEFSIENVQVVTRRKTVQAERKEAVRDPKAPTLNSAIDKKGDGESPTKRRRVDSERSPKRAPSLANRAQDKAATAIKPGHKIGGLIGRKRKERKGAKTR